jgi:hypothetical protein
MPKVDAQAIYESVKKYGRVVYKEEIHCPMVITVMADKKKGRYSAFCVEARISEDTFYNWLRDNTLFMECYALSKMMAREAWEELGEEIGHEVTMPGTSTHRFEHWRMIGWSRYGVGKNARIRLELNAKGSAADHYEQLMTQASKGDFTAGELKQLMEAINVGLNVHQVHALQKEINQLQSDLKTMQENSNVINQVAN